VSRLTGGISLGRSTSLVNSIGPFFRGHSRSTFLRFSHKSASWLMIRIRPYLTCKWTFAPSSTSCDRTPEALMDRVTPLHTTVSFGNRDKDTEQKLTQKGGWETDRPSQSRECCPWGRRRRVEGCRLERGTLLRERVASRCP